MPEFYIVTRYFINTDGGTDGRSQQKFDDLKQAEKQWYLQIGTDIDKDTIAWELCQVIRSSDGLAIHSQIIDNRVPEQGE